MLFPCKISPVHFYSIKTCCRRKNNSFHNIEHSRQKPGQCQHKLGTCISAAVIRTRRTITDHNSHLQPGLGQAGLTLGLIEYNYRSLAIKHGLLPPGEAWDHLLPHVSCHGRTLTGPGNIRTKSSISATTGENQANKFLLRPSLKLYSPSVVVTETKSDKRAALKPNFSLQ